MKHAPSVTPRGGLTPKSFIGFFVTCSCVYTSGPWMDRARADQDALEHIGAKELKPDDGSYRRRKFLHSTEGMAEMFPGAK